MSGMWKRRHGRTSKAPPDERGGYRYVRPTATAPHLDSTQPRHCRTLWRRSLHNAICRPSLWCIADRYLRACKLSEGDGDEGGQDFRKVQWHVLRPFIVGNDFPASIMINPRTLSARCLGPTGASGCERWIG